MKFNNTDFATDYSGSAGSSSYTKGRAGNVRMSKPRPRIYKNNTQLNKQAINAAALQAWQQLTETERTGWDISAVYYNANSNPSGQNKYSGYTLFLSLNLFLLTAGQAINTTPPSPASIPITEISGPIIIGSDGTFAITTGPGTWQASYGLVFATFPTSPGKQNFKKSLKLICSNILQGDSDQQISNKVASGYLATFGSLSNFSNSRIGLQFISGSSDGQVSKIFIMLSSIVQYVFVPPSPASLQLWLKADTGITLASGKVQQWDDQSGNGRNAVAPSATKRVQFLPAFLNGQPCLKKSFADGDLAGSGLNFSQFSISDFTIFVVRLKLASGGQGCYLASQNNYNISMGVNHTGSGVDQMEATNIIFSQFSTPPSAYNRDIYETTPAIMSLRRAGSAVRQKLNNLSELSANMSSNSFECGALLYWFQAPGGGYDFEGYFAEILIYNSYLSDGDCLTVRNYLNGKYQFY